MTTHVRYALLRGLALAAFIWSQVYSQTAAGEPSANEQKLLDRIQALEQRIATLEQRLNVATSAEPGQTTPSDATAQRAVVNVATATPDAPTPAAPTASLFAGTTFGLMLDGYYEYNFNHPIGRINLLRPYDVLSNSFSLNQATMVIERPPDVKAGRRYGVRLDLQYGQATESQQGSVLNEQRPQVYRPVYQAYGTYVFPVGSGLTTDFGKFGSALGVEGNYSKDQFNYSRSFLFTALPFYHFGFRSTYNFNDRTTFTWWLVNGIGQSEDFNGFKSVAFLFGFKPAKTLSWNLNYYTGQENRDINPALNPTFPVIASQPGLSTDAVTPTPNGRSHIFDTYLSWSPGKWTFTGEADTEIARLYPWSAPTTFTGGAGYVHYQATSKLGFTGRGEYVADTGLFSGVNQNLKEGTFTIEYKFEEGFLVRTEYRRDASDTPFFLTDKAGVLRRFQNTATLGMIWWFGNREGAW